MGQQHCLGCGGPIPAYADQDIPYCSHRCQHQHQSVPSRPPPGRLTLDEELAYLLRQYEDGGWRP